MSTPGMIDNLISFTRACMDPATKAAEYWTHRAESLAHEDVQDPNVAHYLRQAQIELNTWEALNAKLRNLIVESNNELASKQATEREKSLAEWLVTLTTLFREYSIGAKSVADRIVALEQMAYREK